MPLVSFTTPRGRLQLRNLQPSDAAGMVARFTTPSIQAALGIPAGTEYTVESRVARINGWLESSLHTNLMLAVVRVADGAVVGQADFGALDRAARTAEAGIVLDDAPDVRGHGYAVEALAALVAFGFDELGLDTIAVGTAEGNAPMRGLMERRFGLVGERRQAEEGEWAYWYTLTKEAWPACPARNAGAA